jgi:mannose-6-phosphate isomerase
MPLGNTPRTLSSAPLKLGPNLLERFFRGGPKIAAFRGLDQIGDHQSEDWIGSAATARNQEEIGLARLPGGARVRDAVRADPEGFLGPEHAAVHGAEPALLVKLLDAGERLFVHAHPDKAFVREHLGLPFGKTEAWYVLVAEPGATLYLGFREEVSRAELDRLVSEQNPGELLGLLNPFEVQVGEALFVPAGVPHAIGEGLLIIEVQEPTDHSIILEWAGFPVDAPTVGHLKLGFDTALGAVDRTAWDAERLASLRAAPPNGERSRLLPDAATPFFQLELLRPDGVVQLEPSFSILLVTRGRGYVEGRVGGPLEVARGDTLLVPFGAGALTIEGDVEIVRCLPPATPPTSPKEPVA